MRSVAGPWMLLAGIVGALALGCGSSSSPMKDAGAAGKGSGGAGHGGAGEGGAGVGAGGSASTEVGGAGSGGAGAGGMDAAAGAPVDADAGGGDAGRDIVDAAREPMKPDGAQGLTYTFDANTQGWAFAPLGSTPI